MQYGQFLKYKIHNELILNKIFKKLITLTFTVSSVKN